MPVSQTDRTIAQHADTGSGPSQPPAGTRATIAQLFATPVARTLCPFAAEVNDPLAARILDEAGVGAKDFGYKQETAGEFTAWAGPDALRLSRWVCAVAGRFTESLVAMPLAEALGRSRQREGEQAHGKGREVAVGVTRSWASLYRAGDRHEAHFHPNTALSAVYYVAAPGLCEIDLLDPRPAVDYYDPGITLAGESHRVRLSCPPGELLVFPGWLKHAVPEFHDGEPRISIAWNLNYTLG
ncbi:2OG-Fe(II) oxygenase family protein [Streptomyces sp. NBC_00424]|uniref:putative 2OG-Fe(II) oxygenase n=1 Tax=Streptomyces sp. NBC_00424 TaxID=2903648 RepID=UPI002253E0C2|nr:putative 2OG-Fe(II) oxygenase [Streptomyces sp. NBC_00424]MCX5078499.1 2OG-Fe(II) oxygenase family protein [Streptomyces sp. NBC_00424]